MRGIFPGKTPTCGSRECLAVSEAAAAVPARSGSVQQRASHVAAPTGPVGTPADVAAASCCRSC